MTDAQFQVRWRTMSYNRRTAQGEVVVFPNGAGVSRRQRIAFGRNGIGRWAAFCFDNSYVVDTVAAGLQNRYRVTRGTLATPFEVAREISDESAEGHGTLVSVAHQRQVPFPEPHMRSEIGMRFLSDPAFTLRLNEQEVTLQDITGQHLNTVRVEVGDGSVAELIVIDTQATDRTSQQKGIAWHVGTPRRQGSWEGPREEAIIDRRRIAHVGSRSLSAPITLRARRSQERLVGLRREQRGLPEDGERGLRRRGAPATQRLGG
jgi:hypothetical protein